MIRLIEGSFFAGGHERIRDEIRALTDKKERALLIVPEQQTVSCEREMTDHLPASAALCFEVVNFTRFSNYILRELGGLSGESISNAKKALFMWRTLSELSPTLTSFGGRDITMGSVMRMLGTVKQLASLAITPQELAAATQKAKEGAESHEQKRLSEKLADISSIMTLYKNLISAHYTESEDYLLVAEKRLAECSAEPLIGVHIYIDGFTSFTEPQYRIISTLIRHCNLTVNLTLPKASSGAFEYSEVMKTHRRIVSLAANAECEVKLERIDGAFGVPPLIADITNQLWRTCATVSPELLSDTSPFGIYEAENPHEECDFVAADIKRRVMAGAKYSEFGIIARRISDYEGILDISFAKADIPLFLSKKSDIASYEVIKLIFNAYAAADGGFAARDVIAYAKCSLCGVERYLVDEFELYVQKWQISGKRFTDGILWNMNPDGYTAARRPDCDAILQRINETRERIIAPLLTLSERITQAITVRDHAEALLRMLISLDTERKLAQKDYTGMGQKENERLWRLICQSLEDLCTVVGECNVSGDTFIALLKILFAESDIGRIPAFCEQVTAGSADTVRMYGKKYIYIIGANAGVFPLPVSDDSYFSDKEKNMLSGFGLSIEADTDIRSAAELYYFARALSYARERVTLLYPKVDTAFGAMVASEAVSRIRAMTGGAISPVKLSSLSPRERIYTRDYAIEHMDISAADGDAVRAALIEAGESVRLKISEAPIKNSSLRLSKKTADEIYGTTVRMSQTKLERYIGCPMSYFCSYVLKLDSNERVEFDNRNIGIFIHSVLECFFAELKRRGTRIADITEDEKRALIKKVATDYVTDAFFGAGELSARLKHTIETLCRFSMPIIDSLCDEFSDCEFEPVFFELNIDRGIKGSPSPSVFKTADGREIYFAGKVDRVDTYRRGDEVFVRVIDYKTGAKEFKPENIDEGKNLQMFLYLKAIVESENDDFKERAGARGAKFIPAGVIYVKANVVGGRISKNDEALALDSAKASQGREGMLLYDGESLAAMNGAYIPVTFKNDGSPDAHSRAKLYTPDGWDKINETIERIISDECTKMVFGDISATPLKEKQGHSAVCKYCDYKAICRNSNAPKD